MGFKALSRTRLIGVGLVLKCETGIKNCFFVTIATTESEIYVDFFPVKFDDREYCSGMSIFLCMKAKKSIKKSNLGPVEKTVKNRKSKSPNR